MSAPAHGADDAIPLNEETPPSPEADPAATTAITQTRLATRAEIKQALEHITEGSQGYVILNGFLETSQLTRAQIKALYESAIPGSKTPYNVAMNNAKVAAENHGLTIQRVGGKSLNPDQLFRVCTIGTEPASPPEETKEDTPPGRETKEKEDTSLLDFMLATPAETDYLLSQFHEGTVGHTIITALKTAGRLAAETTIQKAYQNNHPGAGTPLSQVRNTINQKAAVKAAHLKIAQQLQSMWYLTTTLVELVENIPEDHAKFRERAVQLAPQAKKLGILLMGLGKNSHIPLEMFKDIPKGVNLEEAAHELNETLLENEDFKIYVRNGVAALGTNDGEIYVTQTPPTADFEMEADYSDKIATILKTEIREYPQMMALITQLASCMLKLKKVKTNDLEALEKHITTLITLSPNSRIREKLQNYIELIRKVIRRTPKGQFVEQTHISTIKHPVAL